MTICVHINIYITIDMHTNKNIPPRRSAPWRGASKHTIETLFLRLYQDLDRCHQTKLICLARRSAPWRRP